MNKPRLVEEHEAAGKRIVVEGQHIFVREQGDGEVVLLLHGVPSSSFLYRKMLPELDEKGFRAVSFDFPGVGLSDKPEDIEYDWHALAQWVDRVVDALELPPAISYVGFSRAGPAQRRVLGDEHRYHAADFPAAGREESGSNR